MYIYIYIYMGKVLTRRTFPAALPAGKYLLVPSTFMPGTECAFELRAGVTGVRFGPPTARGRGKARSLHMSIFIHIYTYIGVCVYIF